MTELTGTKVFEGHVFDTELAGERTGFRREIGLFGGVSIIGGIMIGGGIFYLGSYVLQRTGVTLGLSLLCWLIGGVVSLLGGLCYAELGAMIPAAGGVPVYLSKAYHPLVGFLNGFTSWLLTGPASLAGGAVAMAAMFGLQGVAAQSFASAVLIAFTIYNCFGIKQGAILQNITMVAKLIPIFIVMGAALLLGEVSPDLSLTSPTSATGSVPLTQIINMIGFATLATLWAYEGWKNLNAVTEEIHNPKRNLPLSLIVAISSISLLYILFNYAIFRVIPLEEMRELVGARNLYLGTEVAIRLLGRAGGILVTVGMVISMLGSINGMTLAFPRNYYAMAREGHFFRSFTWLHPKYRVPTDPLICQCLISVVFVWFRSLDQLTNLVAFGGMLFSVLVIGAVPILRHKMPDLERPYRVWGGLFTIAVTILINLGIMLNTLINDPVSCITGLAIPAAGALVYLYFDYRRRWENAENAPAMNTEEVFC